MLGVTQLLVPVVKGLEATLAITPFYQRPSPLAPRPLKQVMEAGATLKARRATRQSKIQTVYDLDRLCCLRDTQMYNDTTTTNTKATHESVF